MKNALAIAAILVFGIASAAAQAKKLTSDPLTKLPLIAATYGGPFANNAPDKLPDSQVCRSKMQGNF